MNKLVFLFFLLLLSCTGACTPKDNSGANSNTETELLNPPFTVSKSKMGEFNVWSIEEDQYEIYKVPCKNLVSPKGLLDKHTSKRIDSSVPVYYKDATWSAACRAIENLVPDPEAQIIYNFSKFDRQINNENECLYFGDCEIKDENGEYQEAAISMIVRWNESQDFREGSGWYCRGNITF